MCRTQCVLALWTLCTGIAHSFSWDIVLLSTKYAPLDGADALNGMQFYDNGTKTHSENYSMNLPRDISYMITYDSVHNRVLFTVTQFNYSSNVYSFELASKKTRYLFSSGDHYIEAFTYDPITDTLFWHQGTNDIYSYSFKPESNNEVHGNFITKVDGATQRKVAVDSCGGYVYWIYGYSRIKRARFNDSESEIVVDRDGKTDILNLTIDQLTQKIYWIAGDYDSNPFNYPFSVKCADLDGKNMRTLYESTTKNALNLLTVTKDFIYWGAIRRSQGQKSFWQLQKNPPQDTDVKPIEISTTAYRYIAIAANFNTKDQTQIIDNCEALKSLLSNNSDHDPVNDSAAASLLCVHGTKVSGKSQCKCTQGYTGDRCEVSVCHNYCLQGDCSVSAEGQPICGCNDGYSGARCEIELCLGYCLNNGVCSLNENSEPVCQCTGDYEGKRCTVPVVPHVSEV